MLHTLAIANYRSLRDFVIPLGHERVVLALVSPGTRLVALDENATNRPSSEILAIAVQPFDCVPGLDAAHGYLPIWIRCLLSAPIADLCRAPKRS